MSYNLMVQVSGDAVEILDLVSRCFLKLIKEKKSEILTTTSS